jgi:hypothetical protein
MRAAGRAGKGTALTHDTANNNEEEKPWADKRHFSIIISFYMEWWLHYLSNAIRQLFLTDFFSCSALSPISRFIFSLPLWY